MSIKAKIFIIAALAVMTIMCSGFTIPVPTASGTSTRKNDKAEIDFSNAKDGYVMVRYLRRTNKTVLVVIAGPGGARFQYHLHTDGRWEVFPFSAGNGRYSIGVHENVDGSKYSTSNSADVTVTLADEFAPFIRSNQFVNYNKDSEAVKKAAELVSGSDNVLESVSSVYGFVVRNIEYDKALAAKGPPPGYVPDIDATLKSGKGICFDYASLMTAMLRSQGIPTRLVIGYVGTVHHAWISVWSDETGWVNNIIQFDGKAWRLMDPTFASTSGQSGLSRFTGDGKNYKPGTMY